MGVWIETHHHTLRQQASRVTPCMGVWIETFGGFNSLFGGDGHTLYGCVD